MTRTATPPRTHPHSRSPLDRVRHWLWADPPWTLRSRIFPGNIKDRAARIIRLTWRWRDISPGIVAFVVLWLWARLPTPGPQPPTLPFTALLAACGALSVASLFYDSNHERTANKDRTAHQFKRRWQKAWLDMDIDAPIPPIGPPRIRPHSISAWVELVEGTNEWEVGRKVRQRLGNIYRAPCELNPDHQGGALLVVRHGDPLTSDPELPAYLGNVEGVDLTPTWRAMPIGIDREGDPFTINLFEQHILMPGQTRSGKSSTGEAMGCGCIAARNVEPGWIDLQDVSFAAFRSQSHYAGNVADGLKLLEQWHEDMQKRELEMAEAGTSLATPSARWPLRVLFIDELQKLIDPHIQTKEYAERFKTALKDIMNTGAKTGFVIVAITTNPRKALLEELRDQFTTTICFRTRDHHASGVALEHLEHGFEPHRLPEKQPGRCVVKADGWHHLRTYRLWDDDAVQAVRNLTSGPVQSWPPPAPGTAHGPEPLTNNLPIEEDPLPTETSPRKLTRGEPRDLILAHLQRHGPKSVAEVSEELGIPRSTVKRWMLGSDGCTDKLHLEPVGRHRYQLIGGTR